LPQAMIMNRLMITVAEDGPLREEPGDLSMTRGSAGGIVGQLGLGWIARTHSLASGYLTAGLTLLVAVPPLFLLRRTHEPHTVIGWGTAPCPPNSRSKRE
jgi:hypothetical protein